jgi:hypothetical protein
MTKIESAHGQIRGMFFVKFGSLGEQCDNQKGNSGRSDWTFAEATCHLKKPIVFICRNEWKGARDDKTKFESTLRSKPDIRTSSVEVLSRRGLRFHIGDFYLDPTGILGFPINKSADLFSSTLSAGRYTFLLYWKDDDYEFRNQFR